MRVIALALLLGASSTLGQDIGCFVPGECLNSPAVGISPQSTPEACLTYCQGVTSCLYFTHFADTGSCIAFKDECNLVNDCSDCISGDVSCTSQELTCDLIGQCTGQFIGVESDNNPAECDAGCQASSGCNWWTFDSATGFCTFFGDCDTFDDTCTTCVSGEPGCETDAPVCDVPGTCQGGFVGVDNAYSKEECAGVCQADSGCQYWTYDSSSNFCTKFSSCPTTDPSCSTCVSGERDCPSSPAGTTTTTGAPSGDGNILFIVGGEDSGLESMSDVEAVDLSGASRSCDAPMSYPHAVQYAVGYKNTEGHPIVCGGYSYVAGLSSTYADCYEYDPQFNSWSQAGSLSKARYGTAGDYLGTSKFWVTGGRDLSTGYFDDIEEILVSSGTVSNPGITLPAEDAYHCIVKISETELVLIGGFSSGSGSDLAYIYSTSSGSFQEISGHMGTRRYGHSCGFVKSTNKIIVAGNSAPLGTNTDVLDLTSKTWSTGPAMPVAAHSMSVVYTPDSDGFFLVGGTLSAGASTDIIEYRASQDDFTTRSESLVTARGGAIAFTVDNSVVNCS